MNVRDLTYLVAVERHGSVTRAAEACDVTQPTLSAQLAKIERELGVTLFERASRGLKPTDAGRAVLDHARRVLGAVDDLVAAAHDHLDPLGGTLRLGLIPTLAPQLLPHLLPAMETRLPRLVPTIVEEQTAPLLERLRAGTIEAAMIATPVDDDRLALVPLFDEPLLVALHAKHPLASRRAIAPSEVDPATLLLLSEGHCLRDQALAFCSEPSLGKSLSGDFRAASLETVLQLVEAGLGITLVPETYVAARQRRQSSIVFRPLKAPSATRPIGLAFRRSSARRAVLDELAKLTREIGAKSHRKAL
ncbi:MAG TPA: LysR substrate-binding domain-containing protein [Candidatus Tumulicola sp.]|nr:LysR substrate-binding domain-containing protein [Candidatus Tumulicola sp.]